MVSKFKNIALESPIKLKDMVDYRKNRIISHSICNTEHVTIVLFSLDQEECISDETTPNSECFTILEGKIQFCSGGSTYLLTEGDSIVVPPLVNHSLAAMEKSKFLQTSVN